MSATKSSVVTETANREIIITRTFNAPRELVFEAWTNPKHIVNWWGPNGFTNTTETMDVRPGGVWKHTMHGPDGKDYPNKTIYQEVVRPEKLVYTVGGGRKGEPGVSFEATITFEEAGPGKTLVTMRSLFPTVEMRAIVVEHYKAIEGGNQTLGRLAEFLPTMPKAVTTLPSDREIVITRMFDAPPKLVWEAMTKPEHVVNWWGPRAMKMTVCEIDLRVGGKYTYVHHCPPDPKEYRFIGEFRELDPPHKLVATETFDEPMFGRPTWLATVTLEDVGGKTRFVNQILHESKENRDGHINSGMEAGMQDTFNRLDELLAKLQ